MSIVVEQLVKRYGRHLVVNNVSLEVADGEFFVLLGPSGSGKTTVLRMIAGLTPIEHGAVQLHGRDVTRLPPQHRGVGFVFQHYALFHHMSVAMNIEFALRIRKLATAARRKRCEELLELVGLAGFGERMPGQLSGGQQQRVALARALASQPEVLLLDEPFGALDARIRTDLRRTVLRIQRETRVATVFVTHDQEEAFELADRMGVMNFGRLLEVGTPRELYLRPQTEFVATFLGTANLIVGESTPQGVRVGNAEFPFAPEAASGERPQRVQVLFRPEDVAVKTTPDALHWPLLGKAVVEVAEFGGSFERIRLRLPNIAGIRPISPPVPFGSDSLLVEATRSQHQAREFPLRPGDEAWVGVRRVHALTHPGMSFLLVDDGTESAGAALEVGSQIARLAHARVTVLECGAASAATAATTSLRRKQVGAGFAALDVRQASGSPEEAIPEEAARQRYELVVVGAATTHRVSQGEIALQSGEHAVLLVSRQVPPPRRVLICVALGEPAKQDVLFAARLIRHLGAEATIFTVLPRDPEPRETALAERFLAAGQKTFSLLGVPSRPRVRNGEARQELCAEIASGDHDMIVLGAPLPDRRGRIALDGLIGTVLTEIGDPPVLIVPARIRTQSAAGDGGRGFSSTEE